MFKDLNIVVGITGGIAAYKACGIVSYLKSEGANIDIIMNMIKPYVFKICFIIIF